MTSLFGEPDLLADGGDGIADFIYGGLQLVLRHAQMLGPATHDCGIIHGNLVAETFVLGGLNADHLNHPCLQQQIAAVCESFARQRAIQFCITLAAGWKSFGIATCRMRLIGPVDSREIDIVAKPQHLTSSVMHEHGEQKNDRQRDSDQPKQSTLSERHVSLHLVITMDRQHAPVPLVPLGLRDYGVILRSANHQSPFRWNRNEALDTWFDAFS
jgi:hypothetical protein